MRFWGCDLESIYDWKLREHKSFLLSTDKAACLGSFLHTSSIDTATMMNYTFDVDNELSVTNDSDEDSTVYFATTVLSLILFSLPRWCGLKCWQVHLL